MGTKELVALHSFDPTVSWRVLSTDSFEFIYPPALHPQAVYLHSISEPIYKQIKQQYQNVFSHKLQIILRDDVQNANGYFSPIPYPHLVLYITPWSHTITESIDNELKLLFIHELIHAITIHKLKGPLSFPFKLIFNRVSLMGTTPTLFWEGISILEESEGGYGRLHDPFYWNSLRANLEKYKGNIPPQTVEGNRTTYPSRQLPYLYGGLFVDHLRRQYGIQKVRTFYDRTSGMFPYTVGIVFRSTFGVSLETEWKRCLQDLQQTSPSPLKPDHSVDVPLRLTHTGERKRCLKYHNQTLYYTWGDSTHPYSIYRFNPRTHQTKRIRSDTGAKVFFDFYGKWMAYNQETNTVYSTSKGLVLFHTETRKTKKLPLEGVQSVSWKDSNSLYVVLFKGMESSVVLYNLTTGKSKVVFGFTDEVVYGEIDCNGKVAVVEERRRVAPYTTGLRVWKCDRSQEMLIDDFERSFHPCLDPHKSLLYFVGYSSSAKETNPSQQQASLYVYDLDRHEIHRLHENRYGYRYPAVSSVPNSLTTIYALAYNHKGYDVEQIGFVDDLGRFSLKKQPFTPSGTTIVQKQKKPNQTFWQPHQPHRPKNSPFLSTLQSSSTPSFLPYYRPSFQPGIFRAEANSERIGYLWQWVDSALLFKQLQVRIGTYFDKWRPFLQLSTTTKQLKDHTFELTIERSFVAKTWISDRLFGNHTYFIKNNNLFFECNNNLSIGWLLSPETSFGGWSPLDKRLSLSRMSLFSQRISSGLRKKFINEIVPYQSLYGSIGYLMFTTELWEKEVPAVISAAIYGSHRLLPRTILSFGLKTLLSPQYKILNTQGLPILAHILLSKPFDSISLPSHSQTFQQINVFFHTFSSFQFGLHQNLLTFRKGTIHYLPFYLQTLWISAYASFSHLYNSSQALLHPPYPFLYELKGAITLELDLFYRVRSYFQSWVYVDPFNPSLWTVLWNVHFSI